MATGVAVGQDCITTFQELMYKHTMRYVVFAMGPNNKEIVVEKTAEKSSSWEEFAASLPAEDCRYAVFDFDYEWEGAQRSKVLFVNWAPDTAKTKSKMLYAASKDAFKKALTGIAIEHQATDQSEITYDAVLERVKQFAR